MEASRNRRAVVCACVLLMSPALLRAKSTAPPPAPADNPTTKARVTLGRLLFFDKRLSRDLTVNCATCHDPRKGWTDGRPTPIGVRSQLGDRNTPTVLNAAYLPALFWDGRAATLEDQTKGPIANPKEMDMTLPEAAARIAAIKGYARYFRRAFGDEAATIDRIAKALAAFERTITAAGSPYDRYAAGDRSALSPAAARGLALFRGRAGCANCHSGPNFTDGQFHDIGVGAQRRIPDPGRFAATGRDGDRGAFKTPTLRNLDDTAPYMHDGSLATLADVLDFLDRGGQPDPRLSALIRPLGLTGAEKADLLAFLKSLDGDKHVVEAPVSLPR
ncbi:MAG: c-type cytochrome [Elusimicrobia bacterium]|nr:c-type cytochrome [Elusimicrobiota bacterium]